MPITSCGGPRSDDVLGSLNALYHRGSTIDHTRAQGGATYPDG